MRFLVVFAGFTALAFAQWKHFGEQTPAITRPAIARQMLDSHNAVRARIHGMKPLEWSDDLADIAQKWANHLLETHQFVHSHTPGYGENLYEIEGATTSPEEVVKAWADEAKDYDYKSNTCRGVCGHYTQIIWNSTERTGCAVATGDRQEIWVCEYDPPGNWVGRRPY